MDNDIPTAVHIGIDPGVNGGASRVTLMPSGLMFWDFRQFNNSTESVEIGLKELICLNDDIEVTNDDIEVTIENASSNHKMGVKSAFTFGKNYGAILTACGIYGANMHFVQPQKWQDDFDCRTGGDKNVTKGWVIDYCNEFEVDFTHRITHACADSFIIALWGLEQHGFVVG